MYKPAMFQKIKRNWKLMWLSQLLIMLLIALPATFLPLIFPTAAVPLRVVFMWLLPVTAGAWTSCALTRAGLTSYAAWVLPPVVHSVIPWLLIGYPPSAASMLLCAFISLVGSAAGDVLYRREHA